MKIVRYHIINAFFSDTSIANSLMNYTSTTQATEHNEPQHKKSVRPTSLTKCQAQYLSPQGVWERGFLFVCVVSFMFAWFLFCLRGLYFVCVVPFLFAWFLFCLRVFFFVSVFSFFIYVVSFCLRVFFFVCVFSFLFAACPLWAIVWNGGKNQNPKKSLGLPLKTPPKLAGPKINPHKIPCRVNLTF